MRRIALRIFYLISAVLLFAIPAWSQTTLVTGTVTDTNALPYAGATMKAQLVFAGTPVSNPTVTISVLATCRANGFGSAPCQVPFAPSNGPFTLDQSGNVPGGGITLQDNTLVTPSGTQWAFTVNSAGNPPPIGTGPQTCTATLTISGASQSITASFSACPKLSNTSGAGATLAVLTLPGTCTPGIVYIPAVGSGQVCNANGTSYTSLSVPAGATDPVSFGVRFNGKACFGNVNTITTSGTTVTCNAGNFCNGTTVPCAAGQISDVGKQASTTTGCCGTSFNFTGVSTLASPSTSTTIATVVNPTTVTLTQSAGSNSGASLIFAWASNDDAAMTLAEAAWKAANKCGAMPLPAGITAFLQPHWTNPGANCLGAEPQADYTASVYGQGNGATIVGIFPGFNFAGCPAAGCFGGYAENVFHDMQWNGFGWGNTGAPASTSLIGMGLGSQSSQIACNATGGSDPNLTGLNANIGTRMWGLSLDGCGGGSATTPQFSVNGAIVNTYYAFVGDSLGLLVDVGNAADWTDFGGDFGPVGGTQLIRNDGQMRLSQSRNFGCSSVANATLINQSNGANSLTILDGARMNCASATSNGVFLNGANQKLIIANGSQVGGTSANVLRSAGTVYISNDSSLVGTGANTSFAPTCSSTGLAQTACAIVAGGTNEKGTIRVTAGGVGGAFTETLTFAGTYAGPTGVAPNCEFIYSNTGSASWTAPTLLTISSKTTTSVVIAGTATTVAAQTYDMTYICGGT